MALSILIVLAVLISYSWIEHAGSISSFLLQDNEKYESDPSSDSPPEIGAPKDELSKWMNSGGLAYEIANAPDFDTEWILKDASVRFFDIYSKPIRSLYSQVHWTSHGDIPLPEDVVKRYDNDDDNDTKTDTMAIVGYEVDQLRIDPESGQEISVPITWAYNHHYMAYLSGKTQDDTVISMVEVSASEAMKHGSTRMAMGHAGADTKVWIPGICNGTTTEPILTEDSSDRSWCFFSEGNGGEMRKSYHSYPQGYAQLLRKPQSFSVTPMQIDTWNRETMANTSRFVPPEANPHEYFPSSSSSRIVDNLAAANYNPILECPCSDRLLKRSGMTYTLAPKDESPTTPSPEKILDNSTECFDAAKRLLPSTNITYRVDIDQETLRDSCEAVLRSDGSLEVVWKKNRTSSPIDNNEAALFSLTSRAQRVAMESDSSGLIVGSTPTGSIVNATLILNTTSMMVEITLRGPYLKSHDGDIQERWFAIGLGANSMCIQMQADECITGGPYAIVVLPPETSNNANRTESRVVERKLEYHGAGRILSTTNSNYALTVVSNAIEYEQTNGGTFSRRRRVVRLIRQWEGPTSDYFSFASNMKPLKIILATGCPGSAYFGQHCGHQSPNPISFAQVDLWQEILRDGIKGSIGGKPFHKDCKDEPYGDLVKQKNPTCTLETYQGGLKCCHHDNFLLDVNQTIPWKDQELEYRLKFRFYYQDYFEDKDAANSSQAKETKLKTAVDDDVLDSEPSHYDLTRFYWTTEANAGEYDVPECSTPWESDSCVHVITSRWKVTDFDHTGYFPDDNDVGMELIYAGPHCHAPTCLSMELYNDDTGELLCHVEPLRGKGHGQYDEAGFLAIPPCLWSPSDDALLNPVFLSRNTTLLSIKRANNTYRHTGEMASWQMRGVFAYKRNESDSKNRKNGSDAAAHRRLKSP